MKTALITGGTRGIGLGIARSLAAEGFHLALNGIRPEIEVRKELESIHKISELEVIYCPGDISKPEDRKQILESFYSRFPEINYLINNAGVAPLIRSDLLEVSEESYDRVMDTNLKGPFFLSQKITLKMIEAKRDDPDLQCGIINISSISASVVSAGRGQYCISKAGMSMMSQLFAARLGEYDIPVFEVRPGIIDSDMTKSVKDKYNELFGKGLCIQNRWGTPEDVGKAVASLVRGNFAYSSGQIFTLDGGLTINRL